MWRCLIISRRVKRGGSRWSGLMYVILTFYIILTGLGGWREKGGRWVEVDVVADVTGYGVIV